MPDATLTSKGQVTIPKQVRDALRIDTGDRLAFLLREDGVVELRPATVDLKDLFGVLKRRGKTVSLAEMDEAIAASAAASLKGSK